MICTFYSYKGGVGRSMALANVADSLARSGLRVLMVDFDLEAPGLEQFFPINHRQIRRHLGLLDLLLSYKQSMSVATIEHEGERPFMRLRENFIVPVYRKLPSGGRLDLLPAGQRGDAEQLARYAFNLRTFDWQDFYFNWAGETFFEWLRQALVPELYDVVLIDSRTGVTEMGGICAYQLADVVVMFCASSRQNVEGTYNVVKNFFSPRVQARRRHRRLRAIVVPARVEQRDDPLLERFRRRFEEAFGEYTPESLREAGLSFWDLLVPYEPRYAFEEQVVTEPSRADERRQMAAAFQELVGAIALLAEPGTALANLSSERAVSESREALAVEPQYDVTRQFAEYDAFLSYNRTDQEVVEFIARRLRDEAGLMPFLDRWNLVPGDPWQETIEEALHQSRSCVVFIGPSELGTWAHEELRTALDMRAVNEADFRIIPVLLPGARLPERGGLPAFLTRRTWVDFRSGLDDADAFQRLAAGIKGIAPAPPLTAVEDESPYLGLRPFDEEHASFFFGRDALTQRLVEGLRQNRFLAVVGPSGSGKTSLVRAGLVPQIRRGALPASDRWPVVVLKPGPDPLEALARALLRHLDGDADPIWARQSLLDALAKDDHGLHLAVRVALASEPGRQRLLLVVDQFEELFTLCCDESERQQFIANLLYASSIAGGQTVVIITMRADFYGRCATYPALAATLSDHQILIGPMSKEELRQAIERPAQAVGLSYEKGLVDAILDDLGDEPGVLPLLQFTLLVLWEQRRGGWLTHDAYRQIGGIQGALAHRAENVYAQLTPGQQAAARRVLLRLIRPGEGTEDTRRRATFAELLPAGAGAEDVEAVVKRLADARLLITAVDEPGERVVELAHEALARSWPRLREWMDEDRDALLIHRRLAEAAREWELSERDESYLHRGARLAKAEEWAEAHAYDMNLLEREFLEASVEAREAVRIAARRRVQRVIAGLATGLVIISALAIFAWGRSQLAEQRGVDAENAMATAMAEATRALHAEATAEAGRIQALAALEEVRVANQAAATSYSPDGKRLVTFASDGTARLWDAATGAEIVVLGDSETAITWASFSPDARRIVTGSEDGQVQLWDAATGQVIAVLFGHTASVRNAVFSPDGQFLATASDDGTARIWDIATGELLAILKGHTGPVIDIGFNPDGTRVMTSSTDGTTRVWDAVTGEELATLIEQQ